MAEDQQERQTDLWSAYDRDQEIRELRQQVQALTGVLETFNLTQRQISEHETRAYWYSQHWKSWQDGWWWAAGGTMRNCRGILGKIWIAGLLLLVIPLESGTFQNLTRFQGSPQIT